MVDRTTAFADLTWKADPATPFVEGFDADGICWHTMDAETVGAALWLAEVLNRAALRSDSPAQRYVPSMGQIEQMFRAVDKARMIAEQDRANLSEGEHESIMQALGFIRLLRSDSPEERKSLTEAAEEALEHLARRDLDEAYHVLYWALYPTGRCPASTGEAP